ncbi:MAG: tRNA (adenosine(37)-N6)-threonylcarbamoyltransferase complex ATPase subunit type 1 TsaE [Bacteroidales bacterium]|nr:tRNA (adenosine(37)-N6)-threonylcarbamoyltransferase complex ATPase subunit type 1 TsaE [Bacteroidales bacterium]
MESVKIASLEEIDSAAQQIIEHIKGHRIVCFYGSMGAGKTTLIKAICKALGVNDNVASPTFALVNEYRDRDNNPIFHFDFYRINKLEEVYDFGYEEYFYNNTGICLIEWPELIEPILPRDNVLKLTITVNQDQTRTVEFSI